MATPISPAPQGFLPTLTRDDLARWPKAELHCHLDGSLRLETMLDLAREQGKLSALPSDSIDGLQDILRQVDDSETLEAYLRWFSYSLPLMQSREALRRIAYELAEDNAKENVRYLEVRYGPILHTDEGLTMAEVNEAVLDGLKAAEKDFGIRTGVIVCGLRDRRESASLAQAELAAQYRDQGVVGFDLAGGERGNPAELHGAAFYFARKHLLNITIHAGEAYGPESIRQALFKCGAHRIGHGTSLWQDEELLRYVIDRQIPLEICPTSNVQTHVVKGFKEHPLRKYLAEGVAVTINTDNRLFSRTSVTEELWRVHTECDVPANLVRDAVILGFRHSFLPWEEKQDFVRMVRSAIPQYA
ncbi:MAG: adenosine deaminase [Rhodothermales bacterium]|nr:adenosine deaminase [Rhodothermales bacterium]